MRAHFTPQAEIDLEEVGDYIALDNPRRAVLPTLLDPFRIYRLLSPPSNIFLTQSAGRSTTRGLLCHGTDVSKRFTGKPRSSGSPRIIEREFLYPGIAIIDGLLPGLLKFVRADGRDPHPIENGLSALRTAWSEEFSASTSDFAFNEYM